MTQYYVNNLNSTTYIKKLDEYYIIIIFFITIWPIDSCAIR